jgi:hypothetical protein
MDFYFKNSNFYFITCKILIIRSSFDMFSTILVVPSCYTMCDCCSKQHHSIKNLIWHTCFWGPFSSTLSSKPPTPMLSIVECGSPSPVKRTLERTVVQKCLEQLSAYGYFMPNYSYFLIKTLEEGESVTMTATVERLWIKRHGMEHRNIVEHFLS